MIQQITKTEALKIRADRKRGIPSTHLVFEAANKKWYKHEKGAGAMKEMVNFLKDIKLNMAQEIALFEMEAEPKPQKARRPNAKHQSFH